jgi:DNA-binding FadR family transcriptional regulator
VAELCAILEELENIMRERKDFAALDMTFHRKVAEGTRNIVMESLIPIIVNGIALFAKEVEKPEFK